MPAPIHVTAITGGGRLGGPERVMLDFANLAFEHDIALRVVTGGDGPLVEILNNLGVPTAVAEVPRHLGRGTRHGRSVRSLPRALPALYTWSRHLGSHDFLRYADVILTTAFRSHLGASLARLHPVVWHLHEFPPTVFWEWIARRVPDGTIANSDAVRAAWNAPRMSTVHNGVNLDRFKRRPATGWIHEALGIPPGSSLIGAPTMLVPWKGHRTIIAAFGQIRDSVPDAHLVFVGGPIFGTDEEAEYTLSLTETIGRSARVHLLPFQREIELAYPEFTLAVDYCVRPEPFGRVVVEAMACEIPIVAADEGGPREIVGGGSGSQRESGWLVEPRSPGALARILESALRLPSEARRTLGAAGRRRAEDFFSTRRFAREMAQELRKVAGKK